MPDSMEVPGLSRYLQMKQALLQSDQQQRAEGLQQEFLQKRQALGQNASPEQLTGLATQYASPTDLMHYGLQSQDKKNALAATLVHHNELIDVARERNSILRDSQLNRLTDKQAQDIVKNGFAEQDRKLAEQKINNDKMLREMGLTIAQQNADTKKQLADQATQGKTDKTTQQLGTALERAGLNEADATI